jgi:signal transduction histidine kinase
VSRFAPKGIRGRLLAAILIAVVAVLAGSFFALHQGTGADLRGRIDDQLRADLAEFEASPAATSTDERELIRRSRQFIAGQGYHPDSRVFAVQVGNATKVITNEPRLIDEELSESGADAEGSAEPPNHLLEAPLGLSTVELQGGEELRVLSQPVESASRQIGTFRVAQSLGPVVTAQEGLRDTLLLVGGIALAVLVLAALWIATIVARPLTQMARFAARLDSDDLDRRLEIDRGPAEVQSLATSFNHMLDRLQRAFEREREFVADASHELRTPVTVAQGELDLLRRDLGPDERRRLDVIRRELVRMERLVSEMFTLASADARGALRLEPVELEDVLSDLRRDLPLLGPREYRVGELGGTVDADPDRLAQVLRNLLQNAVSHTGDGGLVEVDVEADGNRVRFVVHDDGPGIPPEEADRLFDRFHRGSGDAGNRGTGLGLAIARAIVEAHGGRIWIESPGEPGATVAFELPGFRPA